MSSVRTPDGYGQVLRVESARGKTNYLVKGVGFEGWYDSLQVTADFADEGPVYGEIDDENNTVLPYPSKPQGPGWDGTTSTIPPDVDPHLELGGASDSLTGESTGDDPVEADIEGLFEPPSRLANAPRRRLHFATSDDPVLDVQALPGESPTGLENSPINPDNVDTDDLFDGSLPHFERESAVAHDRLVIEDDLSFLRYASDDDKKKDKKEQGPGQAGYPKDSDGEDDSGDDNSSSSSDGDGSDGGDSGGGDGGGGHTAAFNLALSTTADLHFLANICVCAETLPLHSKSEHRELLAEMPLKHADFGSSGAPGTPNDVTPQPQDLARLLEKYEQEQFTYQESNLDELVDRSEDDADAAGNLNNYASVKTAAPAADPNAQPTQIESQIEQLMQFWAVDNNGWWHWTGSQADLALLNQMQQQMMAVGMPGGPPGQMQAQASHGFVIEASTPAPWRDYLQTIASDRLVALAAWKDVVQKSKRLRSEGAISVEAFKPDVITAYVQGDSGRYYTTVQRLGSLQGIGRQGLTSGQVSGWSCDCDWGNWAWIRKRSFVGRMCSHAYALFSEMRSLDAKSRRAKGKPFGEARVASVGNKTSWNRNGEGFEWVSDDPANPTAAITRTAAGWGAQVWPDGTADDSLVLGTYKNSGWAQRAAARVITAHVKFAEEGDINMVGGEGAFEPYQSPDSIAGGYDVDPYSQDGSPEPLLSDESQPGSRGIQEGTTRVGSLSVLAEQDDGQDDEGPEGEDDGIEEEEPEDDDKSLDEEIAEDEGESAGSDEPSSDDDGGHDEPHRRDDEDEGTDNPGDESDDEGIEKESSVAGLQEKFGLSHLAGANYSLMEQDKLVREGDGKTARNRGDLNLTGTHYEANSSEESPEETLSFLF